ncbi:hypothetical protein WR25_03880 [Diploscapter pachys]|uniref:DNA helicase n=1 Tax=Diploscapter pachys TaxID=2018661 RepID=A0A2A2JMS6_9BILA|nr:hypothetical protein WR25_03880 [Diploscapter pachys]
MVNVKKGILVTCDPAMRQLLIHLDESLTLGSKFIYKELDETHLFIDKEIVPILEEKLDQIMEQMNPESDSGKKPAYMTPSPRTAAASRRVSIKGKSLEKKTPSQLITKSSQIVSAKSKVFWTNLPEPDSQGLENISNKARKRLPTESVKQQQEDSLCLSNSLGSDSNLSVSTQRVSTAPTTDSAFFDDFDSDPGFVRITPSPVQIISEPIVCGLPKSYFDKYLANRRIPQLYEWQRECLDDSRILNGENFIISLPTGAGKTAVAEILMLRECLYNRRNAILLLPYVAIVKEKISSLSFFEDEFGIVIEEYAASKGRLPPIKRRSSGSVYVATIEKGNMLINSLLEQNQLQQIGLLVVDEMHMIGDRSRGATIEHILIKYRYKTRGQVIGISATMSNLDELQRAFGALLYSTSFRPVPLDEYIKVGQTIHKIVPGGKTIPYRDLPPNRIACDVDGVCQLLQAVVPKNSAIVFCPNKKNCENLALMLSRVVPKSFTQYRVQEKQKIINNIREEDNENIDNILATCIKSGIAFHHSGLTHDERKQIETGFIDGTICVICATSTLAAGVNLPAKMVIIKSPMVGIDRLGKAQYMQMVGRAGRAGFDKAGESYIILKPGKDEKEFRQLLQEPLPSCISQLDSPTFKKLVLDLIALNIARTFDEMLRVLSHSLLFVQKPSEVPQLLREATDKLVEMKLLHLNDDTFTIAPLGMASFSSGIDPVFSSPLHQCLKLTLCKGLVFSSHFHLLYIISPYDIACEYINIAQDEKDLLTRLGLQEGRIIQRIMYRKRLQTGEEEMRLYIAFILRCIWNQESHFDVARKFNVERGWLQLLLQNSVVQAGALARFSEKLPEMWPLKLLLPELVQRLGDVARQELIPLIEIEGVRRARAVQLYDAGYKTVAQVAAASYMEIIQKIGPMRKAQAMQIIRSAKSLLRDKLDEKMEEFEAMGCDFRQVGLKIQRCGTV